MKQYIALVELDEKSYGVVFPDFPGCATVGTSYENAVQMAHEALAGHVECMQEDGYPIPAPRSLEEIEKTWEDYGDWKDSKYAVSYIALIPNHATKKYTISMDASLMARIDAITKNRSAFLATAAQKYLEAG
jgi:predicted RNase H-like HicB family nuclease